MHHQQQQQQQHLHHQHSIGGLIGTPGYWLSPSAIFKNSLEMYPGFSAEYRSQI
jgi:hypothetical protein